MVETLRLRAFSYLHLNMCTAPVACKLFRIESTCQKPGTRRCNPKHPPQLDGVGPVLQRSSSNFQMSGDKPQAEACNFFRLPDGLPKSLSGDNNEYVDRRDFVGLLKDIFDLSLYGTLGNRNERSEMSEFAANETFWKRAIQGSMLEGMRVLLTGFHITEWLPISPGRFFTPDAAEARLRALRYINWPEDRGRDCWRRQNM